MKLRALIFCLTGFALPLAAAEHPALILPEGSSLAVSTEERLASARLPLGPWVDGAVKSAGVDGLVRREVWRTPSEQADTLQLMNALRDQVESGGYDILFACETESCGGFDFRFDIEVLPEPDMHVDLGDFRYLTARRATAEGDAYLGLLVSRSPERGFVQVVRAGALKALPPATARSTKQTGEEEVTDTLFGESLASRLLERGAVALEGLQFGKGAADLGGNAEEALAELAAFLETNPELKVILVGHTDSSGSLKGNIALSRKRAGAVMARLIETYGVNPDQLSAQGVGYLSPRASNATEEGRHLNRRVEAVLTGVE